MAEKLHITRPIIVEGKYDKNTLSQILDAVIITTGGFAVFNSSEKRSLIKRLSEKCGVILLTDSDGGGAQIRKYLSGILPKDKIYHLYIPKIEGKEKRKRTSSKSGLLGVEGMDREVIERIFAPFAKAHPVSKSSFDNSVKMLTKLDFYEDGFSGGADASGKRDMLAAAFGLPSGMSAKALLEAISLLAGYEEYKAAADKINKK